MGLILKTGREMTLVATGTFAGDAKVKGNNGAIFKEAKSSFGTMYAYSLGAFVDLGCTLHVDDPSELFPKYRRIFTLGVGFGLDTDVVEIDDLVDTYPSELVVPLAGTWHVNVPAEEMVEITEDVSNPLDISTQRPTYKLRHYWKRKLGSTMSVTATVYGYTVAVNLTVGTGEDADIIFDMIFEANVESGSNFPFPDGFYENTLAITGQYNGNALRSNYVRTATNADANCLNGALVHVNPVSLATNGRTARCRIHGTPPRGYQTQGVVRAMEQPYPESIDLLFTRKIGDVAVPVTVTDGTFSDAASQRYFSCGSTLNGVDQTGESIDERTPISIDVSRSGNPRSLVELWEKNNAPLEAEAGVWFHGWSYAAIDMAHAREYLVDDCSSTGPSGEYPGAWINGENVTVSVDAGAIKAIVGGGVGRIRREFDAENGASLYTYRYLKITCKASEAATFGIRSYGKYQYNETEQTPKEWLYDIEGEALEVGVESRDIYIDLCSPSNLSDEQDLVNGIYTMIDDGFGGWTISYYEGPYSGVNFIKWLDLFDLDNGVTYWIENVELSKHPDEDIRTSTSIDFGLSVATVYGDYGSTGPVPRAFTEGKLGLHVSCVLDHETLNYTTIGELHESMTDGLSPSDEPSPINPGWTASLVCGSTEPATDGTGTVSEWLNSHRPFSYLWAGGVLANGGVESGFQLAMPRMIYAQPLFTQITDWAPDGFSGDIFNIFDNEEEPAQPQPLMLFASYVIRSGVHGIILNEDNCGSPVVDIDVDTIDFAGDEPGQFSGSGITDGQGVYFTQSPFVRSYEGRPLEEPPRIGAYNALVLCQGSKVVREFCHTRGRYRVVLKVLVACGGSTFIPRPAAFFPFQQQFFDSELLAIEEWRRLPFVVPAEAQARVAGRLSPNQTASTQNIIHQEAYRPILSGFFTPSGALNGRGQGSGGKG